MLAIKYNYCTSLSKTSTQIIGHKAHNHNNNTTTKKKNTRKFCNNFTLFQTLLVGYHLSRTFTNTSPSHTYRTTCHSLTVTLRTYLRNCLSFFLPRVTARCQTLQNNLIFKHVSLSFLSLYIKPQKPNKI